MIRRYVNALPDVDLARALNAVASSSSSELVGALLREAADRLVEELAGQTATSSTVHTARARALVLTAVERMGSTNVDANVVG